MLLSTMNDQELTRAVWLDFTAINKSSTISRLRDEYDRERRKKKILPESSYVRCFSIRSKAKNNWIIFMEKAPIMPKYRAAGDIAFHCVVYYFGTKGFTVFKPDEDDRLIHVYQSHVFTRYCQRMQLHLSNPWIKYNTSLRIMPMPTIGLLNKETANSRWAFAVMEYCLAIFARR